MDKGIQFLIPIVYIYKSILYFISDNGIFKPKNVYTYVRTYMEIVFPNLKGMLLRVFHCMYVCI